jgi:GH15 family glucan-1,4-alpha-glucosidase
VGAVLVGFLPPDDPRVRSTVLAIADELTSDDLVLRSLAEQTDESLIKSRGSPVRSPPSSVANWEVAH